MGVISRQDLTLGSPWMNAAGTLGFRPARANQPWPWPVEAGAFVTNPISLRRRTPAEERALLRYPGGFLLHTGLPNPGMRAALNEYGQRWARSQTPVWVRLLAQSPDEVARMVEMLEGQEGVTALELGIPPGSTAQDALGLVAATGVELPVVVNVPVTEAGAEWLMELPYTGASAISLSGPRGALPGPNGRLVTGRLYGPALFPLALAGVRAAQKTGLPVIAGCGVYRLEDGEALLAAGAWAVQVDTALWKRIVEKENGE